METFECMASRRSVRKFLSVPVEDEKISMMISAAKLAPTAGNLQDFKFILVKEHDKIKQIADACLQQYWIAQAPLVIVVCSDPERLEYYYGVRGTRLYSVQDCAAAIQNILLAANDLGLGACWVGAFNEPQLARILMIPPHARAQAVIPVGYPNEVPIEPSHKTFEEMVYIERYGSKIMHIPNQLRNYRFFERAKNTADKFAQTVKEEKDTILKKLLKRIKKNKEEKK